MRFRVWLANGRPFFAGYEVARDHGDNRFRAVLWALRNRKALR